MKNLFILIVVCFQFFSLNIESLQANPHKPNAVVNLGSDTVACDSLVLDAGNAGATYAWSTGATTQQITLYAPYALNTVFVAVTDASGTDSDSIDIEIRTSPTVNLGRDSLICGGGSLLLDATSPVATAYLWSTGATTPSINQSTSALIWVEVSNGVCIASDTVGLNILVSSQIPTINDTVVCGAGNHWFYPLGNSDIYTVWDSANGGNFLGAGSDSILLDIQQADSFYFEGRAARGIPQVLGPPEPQNAFLFSGNRGLIFDITESVILDEVSLFGNAPRQGTVKLYDQNMQVLASVAVVLTVNGENIVPLNLLIPQGTGYRLMFENVTGSGKLFINGGTSYPLDYGLIKFTGATPVPSHYNYFFNWKIRPFECPSARKKVAADLLLVPVVNLGQDRIVCGGVELLDATSPGASYLWSTGQTTATTNQTLSDTISVRVNLGVCAVSDTVVLDILPSSQIPQVNDTSVCGPGKYWFYPQGNSDMYLIWDAANAGGFVGLGSDSILLDVQQTDSFYFEGRAIQKIPQVLGPPEPQSAFLLSGNRGLIFDLNESVILDEVSLYGNAPKQGIVNLYDQNMQILASIPVTLTVNGENIIPLNLAIPQGTGYRLMFENVVGSGKLFINGGTTYPLDYGLIKFTGATPVASHYNYFFNWKMRTYACPSSRKKMVLTVHPVASVDLGPDTLICGTNIVLDATFSGATYQWSTGAVSSQITVAATDTVSVLVDLNGCTVEDELIVEVLPVPQAPTVRDTSFCSSQEVCIPLQSSFGHAAAWFDQAVGGLPVATGDTACIYVPDSSSFFVESRIPNVILTSSVGLQEAGTTTRGNYARMNTVIRGLSFDVYTPIQLKEVSVYALPTFIGRVVLYQGNTLLNFKQVLINKIGANVIELDFDIPTGVGYRLVMEGVVSQSIYIDIPVSYPICSESICITGGYPVTSAYNFFYNWKVVDKFCASNRVEAKVNINIPLYLNDSIYTCTDTLITASLANNTYLWNTAETSASINVNQTGTYTVQITDGANCSVEDTIFVEIPADAGLASDGILCGQTIFTRYDTTAIFTWSTGDSTSSIDISSPGTYSVIVDEPRGCRVFDTISVTGFDVFPTVNLGPNIPTACDSFVLDAGNSGMRYLWKNGDTTQQSVIRASGLQYVQVTNANGCSGYDTVSVNIGFAPQASFAPLISGFTVNVNNQSQIGTYFWNFGDGNSSTNAFPTHTYLDTGTYTITLIATSTSGCGSDTLSIDVRIDYPTAIDPEFVLTAKVYPNPAHNSFWLELGDDWVDGKKGNLQLYDTAGKLLISQAILEQKTSVVIPNLAEGYYILHIEYGKKKAFSNLLIY